MKVVPFSAREAKVGLTRPVGPVEALRVPAMAGRILLAEDDLHVLRRCTMVLVRFGYLVDVASNGVKPWDLLQRNKYGLLLTDHHMAHMGGLVLIKKLHEFGRSIPVVLMAAIMPLRDISRHTWLNTGMMLYKPFTAEELVDSVRNAMTPGRGLAD